MVSVSEDWESSNPLSTSPPNRLTPLKTPTPRLSDSQEFKTSARGLSDSTEDMRVRERQRYPQVLSLGEY